MAASRLPAPGTKYGPCIEDCDHIDCQKTRSMAATRCRWCAWPIGYRQDFYQVGEDLAHASCEERRIELERREDSPETKT
jgi:hypothetical protein